MSLTEQNDQQLQDIPLQEPVQTKPPTSHQAMDPQRPHSETEAQVNLRGGHEGEMCPGRFCFIIPCPLPCNFCVIPCPC